MTQPTSFVSAKTRRCVLICLLACSQVYECSCQEAEVCECVCYQFQTRVNAFVRRFKSEQICLLKGRSVKMSLLGVFKWVCLMQKHENTESPWFH